MDLESQKNEEGQEVVVVHGQQALCTFFATRTSYKSSASPEHHVTQDILGNKTRCRMR